MMDFNYWGLFLSTVLVLNISPGPNIVFILTKTLAHGKKVGIASSLGASTGTLFYVVMTSMGLSTLLMTSSLAFAVVKIIGVSYLFYLAYQAFKTAGIHLNLSVITDPKKESAFTAFKQGILIDILNPKTAIFFIAFLPQFVRKDHGSVTLQLLYLGLIVVLTAIIIEIIYILGASTLTKKLVKNQRFSLWLNRSVGIIFIILGFMLANSPSPHFSSNQSINFADFFLNLTDYMHHIVSLIKKIVSNALHRVGTLFIMAI
jgi:threonine/homoserine/homoserine lactone efflux protein